MLADELRALFLCESPDLTHGKACGQCHHCAMLHAGSHPDFQRVELLYDDKKKKFNRDINIEQTRDALSFLSMSGLKSRRRVLLIDDANLMNNQSANALLKGLEEPTAGSLLLIVCHDLMRLPATIRSRCMLQPCSPLTEAQVQAVLEQEGVDSDLHGLVLELGQGSLAFLPSLKEPGNGKALLNWQKMVEDVAQADVGKLQNWLDKHVKIIPHELISAMVLAAAQKHAMQSQSWEKSEAVFEACRLVAAWPKEVVRHTLRPAPDLLSYILQLRKALKIRV